MVPTHDRMVRLASAASGNNEFPEEILTNTNNKVISFDRYIWLYFWKINITLWFGS